MQTASGSKTYCKKTFAHSLSAAIVGEIDYEETNESFTKKELFKFLADKKLIAVSDDFGIMSWNFINSNTTNYFLAHSKAFLKEVYRKYSEENDVDLFTKNDISVIDELEF